MGKLLPGESLVYKTVNGLTFAWYKNPLYSRHLPILIGGDSEAYKILKQGKPNGTKNTHKCSGQKD